jgi:hypothetical protein
MNLDKNLALNEKLVKSAKKQLLKYGTISIPFLMRKLCCTESKAKEIKMYLDVAT